MTIPIIIGVTGHRDIRKQDEEKLALLVAEALTKIKNDCPNSPIVMLNSLAEGADQLCAKVALAMGVTLIVPLPMPLAEYRQDFSGESLEKLNNYLEQADEVFVVRSMEPVRDGRDFYYRQAGIFVASHSQLLLALWDGSAAERDGCGTAETVGFMLEQNYSSAASFFKVKGDGAVLHIVTPRKGNTPDNAFSVKLIENKVGSAKRVLAETDAFNGEAECGAACSLIEGEPINEKAKRLDELYGKADALSLRFRNAYYSVLRLLSLLGVVLVLSFLLYDEMESDLFLPLYGIMLIVAVVCLFIAKRKGYHRKYLEYRVLAECLRVQYYLCAAGIQHDVASDFTWSQKNEIVWIGQALRALNTGTLPAGSIVPAGGVPAGSVPTGSVPAGTLPDRQGSFEVVKRAWIDEQLNYHKASLISDERKNRINNLLSRGMFVLTVLIFLVVFIFEFFFDRDMASMIATDGLRKALLMHEGQEILLRGVFKILMGVISAITLFLYNYYGKLSLSRKIADHEKMIELYSAAQAKFEDDSIDKAKLFLELAREEVLENGNWLTYCRDNEPDISL